MAGRQRVGAEILCGIEQVAKLDLLIAGHARDRRLAGDVAVRKARHDGRSKAALVVEHVVGNAERLGDAARVVDVLAGAAAALTARRGAVIVELQRNADDIVALPCCMSAATTEESTPPDMATTTRARAVGSLGISGRVAEWARNHVFSAVKSQVKPAEPCAERMRIGRETTLRFASRRELRAEVGSATQVTGAFSAAPDTRSRALFRAVLA